MLNNVAGSKRDLPGEQNLGALQRHISEACFFSDRPEREKADNEKGIVGKP